MCTRYYVLTWKTSARASLVSFTKRSKREELPTPVAIAEYDVRIVKRKNWRYVMISYSPEVTLKMSTRSQLLELRGSWLPGGDGGLGYRGTGGGGLGGGGEETALAVAELSPVKIMMVNRYHNMLRPILFAQTSMMQICEACTRSK